MTWTLTVEKSRSQFKSVNSSTANYYNFEVLYFFCYFILVLHYSYRGGIKYRVGLLIKKIVRK